MHSQSAGQTCRPGEEFENWRRMLQLLHPLYGHDSLRSEQAYLSDLVSTTGQPPGKHHHFDETLDRIIQTFILF
ncbi:hypothetical protein LAG73_01050 [Pseudoxanthomonas japonensis]|nr:hypothetical protein LAG73_01050 [Pseudoxanthomonas japonensis]